MDDRTLTHIRWRAMGTDVDVALPSDIGTALGRLTALARDTFEREEQRFSRFRDTSELSRVNASGGGVVTDPFAQMVERAEAAHRATDGWFDATLLHELEAAGYDRDFEQIHHGAPDGRPHRHRPGRSAVRPFLDGNRLWLAPGTGLDFGGIAKGWTVDLAAQRLVEAGAPWVMVSAGGDLRVAGRVPDEGFEIRIEEATDPEDTLATVAITRGAIATSSTLRRRWGPDRHHLVDPTTGRPSRSDVVQATTWATTCASAEVASTWAILAGPDVLERHPGVVVRVDGTVETSLAAIGEEAA